MQFPISGRNHPSTTKAKLVAAHNHDNPPNVSTTEPHRLTLRERFDKEVQQIDPDLCNSPIDIYVREVVAATPLELIEIERTGVPGEVLKGLARKMAMPISHMYKILGIAKATAEKKTTTGQLVTGSSGHAAIGMIKLLGVAQNIAANSTAAEVANFNVGQWLGQWIERPQAALGGRKPSDLIDTPTGMDVVTRLLGSIESGAYQ